MKEEEMTRKGAIMEENELQIEEEDPFEAS
jgi:hypothetical protein